MSWWSRWRRPPPPPPVVGVLARRIAELERLAVNTFSSLDADSNVWGSWPADYSGVSVVAALRWLVGSSGLTIGVREYFYAGRAWQAGWCRDVAAATGARFSFAVGANGGVDTARALAALAVAVDGEGWLETVEGINEPNGDFGSGAVPVAVTVAAQYALADGVRGSGVSVAGPSIVFGLPYPEGYITPAYASSVDMLGINVASELCNGHLYPPSHPDLDDGSGRGAMRDVVIGLRSVYGALPLVLSEWHPTLYNARGHALDPAYDCYYGACFILAAIREGVVSFAWYALLDYGSTYLCGLFPKTGGVAPRPVAETIRAMFTLTGDVGVTKRTFTPGRLDFTVSGLPADGQTMLFQNSSGLFFLFLWRVREDPGGDAVPVKVTFSGGVSSISDYRVSDAVAPRRLLQAWSAASAITVSLDASVHLLVIRR